MTANDVVSVLILLAPALAGGAIYYFKPDGLIAKIDSLDEWLSQEKYRRQVDASTMRSGRMMKTLRMKYWPLGDSTLLRNLCARIVTGLFLAVSGIGGPAFADEVGAWNDVVPGATLGPYRHGTYPSWGNRTHAGIDLVAECGADIKAFHEGTVTDVLATNTDKNFKSLGYMVIIEHPEVLTVKRFFSLYLHMAMPPSVRKGQYVAKGDKIGLVGTTGAANDICHTHFEIRYFPGRFSAWGNIYGPGDKRGDLYFKEQWKDPLKFELPIYHKFTLPRLSRIHELTLSITYIPIDSQRKEDILTFAKMWGDALNFSGDPNLHIFNNPGFRYPSGEIYLTSVIRVTIRTFGGVTFFVEPIIRSQIISYSVSDPTGEIDINWDGRTGFDNVYIPGS